MATKGNVQLRGEKRIEFLSGILREHEATGVPLSRICKARKRGGTYYWQSLQQLAPADRRKVEALARENGASTAYGVESPTTPVEKKTLEEARAVVEGYVLRSEDGSLRECAASAVAQLLFERSGEFMSGKLTLLRTAPVRLVPVIAEE